MKLVKIVFSVLVCIVLVAFVVIMSLNNWDFKALGGNFTHSEFEVSEDFDSIEINTVSADLVFLKSEDGKCKVVTYMNEKLSPSVTATEGKLVIDTVDLTKWYNRISLFSFDTPQITVYLPSEEYGALNIDLSTGDTEIPVEFKFDALSISASTGDVQLSAAVKNTLKIDITTGDIAISDTEVGALNLTSTTGDITLCALKINGAADIKTGTGEIKLNRVNGENISVNGTTADVELSDTVLSGKLDIDITTGDVSFDKSDAWEIKVVATTGDIKGTLLSEKIFLTDTTTGDVEVPKTVNGGSCSLATTTGDIEIYIEN